MKQLLKYKVVLATVAMAFLTVVMGIDAQAITVNRKVTYKYTSYVGNETSQTGAGFKINNKKISKMKKKVKAIKTGHYDQYNSYRKSGYFDSDVAYKPGKCKADGYKYLSADSYTFRFLKEGTYKISCVYYSNQYNYSNLYQLTSTRSEIVNGEEIDYYELRQRNYSEEDDLYYYEKVGTAEYVKKYIDDDKDTSYYDDYTYYECVTDPSKKYAYGDQGPTKIQFKKGADGKLHMYYDPIIVKTTYVYEYKIQQPSNGVIKSVQLGKSKYSANVAYGPYNYTSTSVSKRFLTGKSGKVNVKMNKGYAVQSIVAVTYDKDGKRQYQLVKNNGKVTYGKYKQQSSSKSETGTQEYTVSSMYKPTMLYVFYHDKEDDIYTKIKEITQDEDGDYKITYERKLSSGEVKEYTSYYGLPYNNYTSVTFYMK